MRTPSTLKEPRCVPGDNLMANRVALLRWTGRGNLSDLQGSVAHILKERRTNAKVTPTGGSLLLQGADPVSHCITFENLPGVAWAAAGYSGDGVKDITKAAAVLARTYLRKGTRFSVQAEATGADSSSDLAGAVMAAMLEEVKGARAANDSKLRFRAAMDRTKGVVGVEITEGPGGVPMGDESVTCLVSGGVHSSVLAWDALVSGYRVGLVHAASGEGSLRGVARLYAELSNRVDPRGLSLRVLEGGDPGGMISKYVALEKGTKFAGFTAGHKVPPEFTRKVASPLYLLPEEEYVSKFRGLKLKSVNEKTRWGVQTSVYRERSFGGIAADVSGVLDGLA
jgi:hypothetical protein